MQTPARAVMNFLLKFLKIQPHQRVNPLHNLVHPAAAGPAPAARVRARAPLHPVAFANAWSSQRRARILHILPRHWQIGQGKAEMMLRFGSA